MGMGLTDAPAPERQGTSWLVYLAGAVVVVALIGLIAFFSSRGSKAKINPPASSVSSPVEPDVNKVATTSCPQGEVQVHGRWDYPLVGFCKETTTGGSVIVVRTVNKFGDESMRRFNQNLAGDGDLEELQMWVQRMEGVLEELGLPPLPSSQPHHKYLHPREPRWRIS